MSFPQFYDVFILRRLKYCSSCSISSLYLYLQGVPINPIIRSRIRISLLCLQFFVYDLTVYGIVFSKTRKLQYINRVNLSDLHCSSCGYIRHIFPVFYRFHKINSNSHNNIMAFEIRYFNYLFLYL